MVLSATMTPYVMSYVHTSLRLPGSVALIHRKVDRPEIFLSRRFISQGNTSEHTDLHFLVPEGTEHPDSIVPTIVFTDSRAEVSNLVNEF
jgi:hypothetical protein